MAPCKVLGQEGKIITKILVKGLMILGEGCKIFGQKGKILGQTRRQDHSQDLV